MGRQQAQPPLKQARANPSNPLPAPFRSFFTRIVHLAPLARKESQASEAHFLNGDSGRFATLIGILESTHRLTCGEPLLACPVPRHAGFSILALLDKPAVAPKPSFLTVTSQLKTTELLRTGIDQNAPVPPFGKAGLAAPLPFARGLD